MLKNAVLYGRIILLALPFNTLQLLFQSFCVTAEKPKLGLGVRVLWGVTIRGLDGGLGVGSLRGEPVVGVGRGLAAKPPGPRL